MQWMMMLFVCLTEAWRAVTDKVQDARGNARIKRISFMGLDGLRMFGLCHDAIIYLIEQLSGAHNCHNYRFKHHVYDHHEEEVRLLPM